VEQRNLKFLVDVGVSKKVERWLIDNGYNIKSVRDINPKMIDKEILKIAVSEGRMVITMDKDFGELVYNSGLPHAGVLLLRLEGARSDEKVKIIEEILEKYLDKLLNNFCVFKDGQLRIRKQ
jgi:predicted nuclease of predicted toxin-antitoxin system